MILSFYETSLSWWLVLEIINLEFSELDCGVSSRIECACVTYHGLCGSTYPLPCFVSLLSKIRFRWSIPPKWRVKPIMLQTRIPKYLNLRFEPSSHRSILTCFIIDILLLVLFIVTILLWIRPGIEILTMATRAKSHQTTTTRLTGWVGKNMTVPKDSKYIGLTLRRRWYKRQSSRGLGSHLPMCQHRHAITRGTRWGRGFEPPLSQFWFFTERMFEPTILSAADMISLAAEALSPPHRLVHHDVQLNSAWMVYPI